MSLAPNGKRREWGWPAVVRAVMLCAAVSWMPWTSQLRAQNQPADAPTPAVQSQIPQIERMRQLLGQAENREISQYLNAPADRLFGPLGRLQHNAAAELARVQNLLAGLKANPEASGRAAPEASQELRQVTEKLGQLAVRLKMRVLVEQLADRDWRKREAAQVELEGRGTDAVPELTWGLQSADPEMATRCLDLLVQIRGRGYIGIAFVILPPALTTAEAAQKGLPFLGGVEVDQVQDGLPGANAGLQSGDIIIALGPTRIFHWSDLLRAVDRLGPEAPTTITFVRDGKTITAPLKLGTRPDGIN